MIDKVKNNVNSKDHVRLGLVGTTDVISEKKKKGNNTSNVRKTVHVGVLEKIKGIVSKTDQNESVRHREIALRVWSKKSRKGNWDGLSLQIVNKGKIKRDRGVTMEAAKHGEKPVTGVYTRICWKDTNGRNTVSQLVNQYSGETSEYAVNRRSMGRKVQTPQDNNGKRMWLNKSLRSQAKRREILSLLKATASSNEGMYNQTKTVYMGLVLKGLITQRLNMTRRRASMEAKQKTK